MLLTRASEYALLALIVLAQSKEPMGADKLALSIGISKSFLAKVLQSLAKSKLLVSYKGVKGGFALALAHKDITLLDIMQAAEGKPPAVFDCSPSQADCPSDQACECKVWPVLNNLQEHIDSFLMTLTLEDIMRQKIG